MIIKNYRHIIYLGAGFVLTLAAYLWLINSSYLPPLKIWLELHGPLFILSLFTLKVAGIVWPPLPGGLLTLGAVAVVPWWQAYLVDFAGSVVGTSIAYFLARRWGIAFVAKIFDEELVEKIRRVKIRPGREIESIFIFRLFGVTVV